MKREDKELLMMLVIFGAIILAGGIGGAVLLAHKTHSIGDACAGFACGSFFGFVAIYLAGSHDY